MQPTVQSQVCNTTAAPPLLPLRSRATPLQKPRIKVLPHNHHHQHPMCAKGANWRVRWRLRWPFGQEFRFGNLEWRAQHGGGGEKEERAEDRV